MFDYYLIKGNTIKCSCYVLFLDQLKTELIEKLTQLPHKLVLSISFPVGSFLCSCGLEVGVRVPSSSTSLLLPRFGSKRGRNCENYIIIKLKERCFLERWQFSTIGSFRKLEYFYFYTDFSNHPCTVVIQQKLKHLMFCSRPHSL